MRSSWSWPSLLNFPWRWIKGILSSRRNLSQSTWYWNNRFHASRWPVCAFAAEDQQFFRSPLGSRTVMEIRRKKGPATLRQVSLLLFANWRRQSKQVYRLLLLLALSFYTPIATKPSTPRYRKWVRWASRQAGSSRCWYPRWRVSRSCW